MVNYVCEGFGKIVGENGGGGGSYQWCGLWGYRNDWDAGLMHVGARYYEVETGRFIQKDLVEFSYIYYDSDPINKIDPNGHLWEYLKNKIDSNSHLWEYLKRIKQFFEIYEKIKEFVSNVAVSWYILYIDMKTQIALRKQLRE